jgi:hypothetical protein
MGEYWYRVWRRAMSDTLSFFGWGSRVRLAKRSTAFLLTVGVATYFGAGELAKSQTEWLLYAALVSTGLFLAVLVLFFIRTPHRLDREIREQRNAIADRLNAREISQDSVNRVQAAYDRGRELQSTPGLTLEPVRDWCADTEQLLDEFAPPHEAWMFRTVEDEAGQLGAAQAMAIRLNKLRRIIARMSASIVP